MSSARGHASQSAPAESLDRLDAQIRSSNDNVALDAAKELVRISKAFTRKVDRNLKKIHNNDVVVFSLERQLEICRVKFAQALAQEGIPDDVAERIASNYHRMNKTPQGYQRADAVEAVKAVFAAISSVVEPSRSPLPDEAPELYRGMRESGEEITEFLGRVWGDWLDGSLTRADFLRLDPKGYARLTYWLGRGEELPKEWKAKGWRLPEKRSDINSRKFEAAGGLEVIEKLAAAASSRLRRAKGLIK